jgi:hypothetical protein
MPRAEKPPLPVGTPVAIDIAQGMSVAQGVIATADYDDGWPYRILVRGQHLRRETTLHRQIRLQQVHPLQLLASRKPLGVDLPRQVEKPLAILRQLVLEQASCRAFASLHTNTRR